jgi:hypothetical protein
MLPTPENDNMFGCKHPEGEFVGNIHTHALTPIIFQNYREDEFLWDIFFNMPLNTTPEYVTRREPGAYMGNAKTRHGLPNRNIRCRRDAGG